MKNFINYYYGLIVEHFKKFNDVFFIMADEQQYIFKPLIYDDLYIYNVYLNAKKLNKPCYAIILNLFGNVFTTYNNVKYILIKISIIGELNLDVKDIVRYSYLPNAVLNIDWKELWQKKIDYYEYQINQLGYKYASLKNSINYYIGMSECAISILNFLMQEKIKAGICHRRIQVDNVFLDFFDPTNLMFDNLTRDIAEYLKDAYINHDKKANFLLFKLDKVKFDNQEAVLLLSRMMYPSYYFDLYDKILKGELPDTKILDIVKKNVSYEKFLRDIYNYLKKKYNIPNIEWLN